MGINLRIMSYAKRVILRPLDRSCLLRWVKCGIIVFTIGSLFCALSHDLSLLVISRVFQGFGAAMIMSVNTSLIKLIYPKRRLGEGVGLNATVVAIASVAGPTLAAGILSVASWPWLFAINVPVGVVTFFMGRRYLPDNAVRVLGHRFNWKEALLNAATFGLFIGCVEAYSHDVPVTWVLGGIVSFVIIGTFYVRMQLRERYPMLPFDLLKIPIFSMSVVTSILSFTAQMLSLVAMPFLLATTFHYDAVGTGLLMTSWPLVIVFVAPLAGLMIGKVQCIGIPQHRFAKILNFLQCFFQFFFINHVTFPFPANYFFLAKFSK